jgi:membrane-bound hydrogenase subunit beta
LAAWPTKARERKKKMNNEENIVAELKQKFPYLSDKIRVQRVRRIWAEVDYSKFAEVFDFMIKKLNLNSFCTVTGLDENTNLSFVYHIARHDGIVMNLKTSVPKDNPRIKTITNYFPAADVAERELVDLLGAEVEGLKEGFRYPLTDDWPKDQHPLRKDWKGLK